ncbi:uncharacterized protein KY384_007119 [Bacidia gigantensis]|uniref:uncharacterized protein n=1 Tax=Bacidia gigantensis TaxID=2732470 RepID=UPI001D0507F9|nr:uncharacterized protein KY384_007119 [Bacidia gigantensis]KAG8528202.1 hypothetical protein KY384_007119 [Bacidia gigantensis]
MVKQPLSMQYIDRKVLMDFLDALFGSRYEVEKDIHNLLKPEIVQGVLEDQGIEKEQLQGLADNIVKGKRAIFSILVCIREVPSICKFVEGDRFDDQDQKLPYDLEDLHPIFSTSLSKEFYDQQWEFIAPIFSKNTLPRVLDKQIILPFKKEEGPISCGGFGDIYKIQLHDSQQCFFDAPEQWCVRKEFHPLTTKESDYKIELRNLSMLNSLRHSNIIEVLSAYTYKGKHNLIFPALSGDLSTLLECERRHEFTADKTFVTALAKLASAIEEVHDFTSRTIDLRQIGCHHDLRPKNILVEGTNFVLADFGLSRFKDTSQTSNTMYQKGLGDYLAPECQDLDGEFTKHNIRRSSDIWSFGCIISEILTFIIRGPDGVEKFWELRGFKTGKAIFHLFHKGPHSPSDEVHSWLKKLTSRSAKPELLLVQLIEAMLSIEPDLRPSAMAVTARLCLIALYYTAQDVDKAYGELFEQAQHTNGMVDVFIERARYTSWKQACGISDTDDLGHVNQGFTLHLDSALDLLERVKREIDLILPLAGDIQPILFLPIRHLNNRLLNFLPVALQESARDFLESNILTMTNDPNALKEANLRFEDDPMNKNISALTSIKRMSLLVDSQKLETDDTMCINRTQVKIGDGVADFNLGEFNEPTDHQNRFISIEWLRYNTDVMSKEEGLARLSRLSAIAQLMNSANLSPRLRTLHCSAYFHDPKNLRFGLVFDLPQVDPSPSSLKNPLSTTPITKPQIFTLHQIIESTPPSFRYPLLGDKFKLAHALALAISEFHKVNWLHKSISSFHTIFLPPRSKHPNPAVQNLTAPYLIAQNHSRPEDAKEWTFGPTDTADSAYLDYQHPAYLSRPQNRYRKEYDYYSLGLVLLEIGLWERLSSMIDEWKGIAPGGVRERLIKEKVPKLGRAMGWRYQRAVERCLKGDVEVVEEGEEEERGTRGGKGTFEEVVVRRLGDCTA